MEEKQIIRNHIDSNPRTASLKLGQYKLYCPNCSDQRRKHKKDTPLSVNISVDMITYYCHHCNIKGGIPKSGERNMKIVSEIKGETKSAKANLGSNSDKSIVSSSGGSISDGEIQKNKLSKCEDKISQWLGERKIELKTAEKMDCVWEETKHLPVIGFPFRENGKVSACKWRTANGKKDFWWTNSASRLWGKEVEGDNVIEGLVITEGEMDALSIKQAFLEADMDVSVFSVPNGSPNKITDGKVDPSEDGRFKYVWNDKELLDRYDKIILASDIDTAGDCLVHELSRRLGKAKCYRVNYNGYKDANELLMNTDEATLRKQVLGAEPIPLHGLNSMKHYSDEFESLYKDGKPSGISTGIKSLDDIFTLQTGQLYVVTGWAGHGKSAFLDQVIVNAGKMYGWKTCYASFEKPPSYHSVQLAQILTGKPFFEGNNIRMSESERDQASAWIDEHILFQDYLDGGLPTIEAVLEKAQASIQRMGCRMLVIDPFNFIHSDKSYALETDMVSDMLSKVQLFAKQTDCLVWFVAHPSKPFNKEKVGHPTPLDIAKSMAWSTKPDVCLAVHRGNEAVEIHCTKARWYWNAKLGCVKLNYNPVNGRYGEIEEQEDNFDWDF
tara:strand:- start:6921 stop:8753 length:1833 start_codon:yes stop_codon:yes gene_type:complete